MFRQSLSPQFFDAGIFDRIGRRCRPWLAMLLRGECNRDYIFKMHVSEESLSPLFFNKYRPANAGGTTLGKAGSIPALGFHLPLSPGES